MDQGHPQGSRNLCQMLRTKRRAVVNVQAAWQSPAEQRLPQAVQVALQPLTQIKLSVGNQALMSSKKAKRKVFRCRPPP